MLSDSNMADALSASTNGYPADLHGKPSEQKSPTPSMAPDRRDARGFFVPCASHAPRGPLGRYRRPYRALDGRWAAVRLRSHCSSGSVMTAPTMTTTPR